MASHVRLLVIGKGQLSTLNCHLPPCSLNDCFKARNCLSGLDDRAAISKFEFVASGQLAWVVTLLSRLGLYLYFYDKVVVAWHCELMCQTNGYLDCKVRISPVRSCICKTVEQKVEDKLSKWTRNLAATEKVQELKALLALWCSLLLEFQFLQSGYSLFLALQPLINNSMPMRFSSLLLGRSLVLVDFGV